MENQKIEEAWYELHKYEINKGEYDTECPYNQQQNVSDDWKLMQQLIESQQNQCHIMPDPKIIQPSIEEFFDENERNKIKFAVLVAFALGMIFRNNQKDT